MRRRAVLALCGVLAAVLSPEGRAAGPFSVETLLARGERVFVGQVVDAKSRWGEGRRVIWTDYVFSVEEPWSPGVRREEVLSVAGGTVDDETIEVSHTARFEIGETYLVSAWRNEHFYHSAVVAGDRAYYRRALDEETRQEVFLDPDDHALEVGPSGEIEAGRLAEPAGRPGVVRFPSAAELAARPNPGGDDPGAAPVPVYRDPSGRIVPPLAVAPDPDPANGCLASRADLRQALERGLAALQQRAARGVK